MSNRFRCIPLTRYVMMAVAGCAGLTLCSSAALAADPPASAAGGFNIQTLGEAIFAAFVLAVLLESALALLFNWRPFVRLVDGRGLKTIISFVLACIVVSHVDLDLLRQYRLASNPKDTPVSDLVGYALTAMIVAGGSSGVNTLLVALGFRSETRAAEVIAKPPPEFAWLAVRLIRTQAMLKAPVRVSLATDGGTSTLIGMIRGEKSPPAFFRWFLQDPSRFPTVAGYSVPGDHSYALSLQWDVTGTPSVHEVGWGPFPIGKGAIIDIDLCADAAKPV